MTKYDRAVKHRKYASLLISLPLVFIIWVSIVIFQAVSIREDVGRKVEAISVLSQIRSHLTSDEVPRDSHSEQLKSWLIDVEEMLEPSVYDQLSWSLKAHSETDKSIVDQLNAKIGALRGELGIDSQKLGKLWSQVTAIGLLACVFALASALLFLRVLGKRQELQSANDDLSKLNSELDARGRELESINETKDRLFAIIGHDLRSPINSLKGLFDLVDQHSISQEQFLQFSSKLKHGVEHVHFALNNLLQWAHSQMQGIQTIPKSLALSVLTHEVMGPLKEFATNKNIDLDNLVDPSLKVWADPDQVKLILRNLLSNAIKFTQTNGHVKVETLVENGHCQVIIKDNGIGISAIKIPEFFSSIPLKSGYGTQGEKGTGLGLILCKEFVEKNKGRIWVESTENKETTFYFTLPIVESTDT